MSSKRRCRINREVAVIRMFFFKVIFGFNIGITIGQYIRKALNNLLNFGAGKFGADPENEMVNFFHGFVSFGLFPMPHLFARDGWGNNPILQKWLR